MYYIVQLTCIDNVNIRECEDQPFLQRVDTDWDGRRNLWHNQQRLQRQSDAPLHSLPQTFSATKKNPYQKATFMWMKGNLDWAALLLRECPTSSLI